MRRLGFKADELLDRGRGLAFGPGFQKPAQKNQRNNHGRAVIIDMRGHSRAFEKTGKKSGRRRIRIGGKGADRDQRIHIRCFLKRGFIGADKKTAPHPEYSRRGQHKHRDPHDLMGNEVQKTKPVLHGAEKNNHAQYRAADDF